ncbi:response regulator [Spirulina sp. CS-785/01]|uniref:response regulator n=1 Tax=Spirulina sp. CS-785/01 TaxID=3021716 RepID=UPI00232B72A6|nr:response regulator [Spirulina sp. CS-785/01]MDB9315733.1 response regulator [Spirulina sp. CS-785/01]
MLLTKTANPLPTQPSSLCSPQLGSFNGTSFPRSSVQRPSVQRSSVQRSSVQRSSVQRPSVQNPSHSNAWDKNLLLIEPERDLCEITQMSLEMTTDWRIWAAESCQEGLAIARRQPPHVILLDLDPQAVNPQEIIQQLQQHPVTCNTPIIVFIERVRLGDQQRFAQLGVAGVIAKPFDALNLGSQIAYLLDWPELAAC